MCITYQLPFVHLDQMHALKAYRGSEAAAASNSGSVFLEASGQPHAPAALLSLKRLQYPLEIRLDVLQG